MSTQQSFAEFWEAPPLPADVLFCVFQLVIGWLDLQMGINMDVPWPSPQDTPWYFEL